MTSPLLTIVLAAIFAGTPHVRGAYDRDNVRRVARHHQPELQLCYDQGRMENDSLYGRVVVQLSLASNGTVASLAIEQSTVNDAKFERCLLDSLRRWRFHKPRDGAVAVTLPILVLPD